MPNEDNHLPKTSGGTVPDSVAGNGLLEQRLCTRLASDVLANALFVADAQMSDALRSGLPAAGRRAIEAARAAISNAARSGLVLLTVSKPGMEPKADLDVTREIRLAASMLRRIDPELPEIEVAEGRTLPLARLPIGLPARLLVRILDCHREAERLKVTFDVFDEARQPRLAIRFESDRPEAASDLEAMRSLLEPSGGQVHRMDTDVLVTLPTSFGLEGSPGACGEFLANRAPRTCDPGADTSV